MVPAGVMGAGGGGDVLLASVVSSVAMRRRQLNKRQRVIRPVILGRDIGDIHESDIQSP
jgi:hypothetical protein